MNVVGHIKVDMAPVQKVMDGLGVTARGDVQKFHTANVRRRIQKYMPYRTGATIKLMIVQSPADEPFIHVDAPYARMLYYGKVMVDPDTGAAGFLTKNGWRSKAGPFWDRRLIAEEGPAMQQDLQAYVDRRAGR